MIYPGRNQVGIKRCRNSGVHPTGAIVLQRFRSVVEGFAAVEAVVLAVGAEPDLVESLADGAVLVAVAALFILFADVALESFGHGRTIARIGRAEKCEVRQPC